MVRICPAKYPKKSPYQNYFDLYSYQIPCYQKYVIEAIVANQHCLFMSNRFDAKRLSTNFTITHHMKLNHRILYIVPFETHAVAILEEFKRLYPTVKVGLYPQNIDSTVLIICANDLLHQIRLSRGHHLCGVPVDIHLENYGVAIWDHFELMLLIPELSSVFEPLCTILARYVQMIWISCVFNQPTLFCKWIEQNQVSSDVSSSGVGVMNSSDVSGVGLVSTSSFVKRCVYLIKTVEIGLPVTHYSFITTNTDISKRIKDPAKQSKIDACLNTLHVILTEDNSFHDSNYSMIGKMLTLFDSYHVRISRMTVFKEMIDYMLTKQLFPAICYQLNIKEIETTVDSIPAIRIQETEPICISFMSTHYPHLTYQENAEYLRLIELSKKGIGIYCPSLQTPFYHKLTKHLFDSGYIDLLLCVVEPYMIHSLLRAKTIICTDMNMIERNRNCDDVIRPVSAYEYMKLSSYAGREGIESIGNVIHLNNLFRNMNVHLYKSMVKCVPIPWSTPFLVSHSFLLGSVGVVEGISKKEFLSLYQSSFMQLNIQEQIHCISGQIDTLMKTPSFLFCENPNYRSFVDLAKQFIQLTSQLPIFINKQKRSIQKRLQQFKESYPKIEEWTQHIHQYESLLKKRDDLKTQIEDYNTYFERRLNVLLQEYVANRFVELDADTSMYSLTTKGQMANLITECPGIILTEYIELGEIVTCNSIQLVAIFSCLVPFIVDHTVSERQMIYYPDDRVIYMIRQLETLYYKWENIECREAIVSDYKYILQYDLLLYAVAWYNASTDKDCENILQKIKIEKKMLTGEFIHAIHKIQAIVNQCIPIATYLKDMYFVHELIQIRPKLIKIVC